MVLSVISPAGTMVQTTRGAASFSTSSARLSDVGDVRVVVETDDLVPGGADPLAHVAAHPAETDKAELHGVPPRCACSLQLSISGLPGSA